MFFSLSPFSISFEVVFLIDDNQYRYGIELTNEKIISEYLYVNENKKEVEVFKRSDGKIKPKEKLGKIGKMLIAGNMVKDDVPFISALNEWNDEMARKVVGWFKGMVVISGNELPPVPINYINDNEIKSLILTFLKIFDINIEDIAMHETTVDSIPEKIKELIGKELFVGQTVYDGISSLHKVYDQHYSVSGFTNFQMEEHESYGTNRLLRLCMPLIMAIKNSSVLFIDEFDSGIHPNILNYIISLFYTFGSKAQLIINTQNSSLLNRVINEYLLPGDLWVENDKQSFDILSETASNIIIKHNNRSKPKLFIKDQIYFVNKNRYGVASLVPLTEYKNIRANLEELYLKGLLDGTPSINSYYIDTLFSKKEE